MYRIWEHPDTRVPDRPPVCIVTCSWYPQIRLKALACPDVSVDEFICGLQLPDAVYRILTGNRPTNIYIGNECRVLDGYGEHKAKPLRHVAIALRLITEMGKCTLLFPDQYLNLREDTLAELVCCETIAPTTRKVHAGLVGDRPLLDAEEQQFLSTQHPNSQWLWSSTLAPLLRQLPVPEKSARPLPPWKPPQELEWMNYSSQHRRRRRQYYELGHGSAADASVETSKTQEEVPSDESREVGKRERTFERNTLERVEGLVVEVDTIAQPLDEPSTQKPSLNGNNETRDHENHPHKRARIESGFNKPKDGEVMPNLDDAASDSSRSPLGKAVTELGSIIKSLTNASPGNIKSPLKQAITKLGGNIDMLKMTSNMDKGSQHHAMTQLDDHIQHLKTLSDGIDEEAADLSGGGEDNTITKDLFRLHDAVSLSTTTNDMGPSELIPKNQAPVPEVLPPLVSDTELPKGQRGETTNGGKVPLLVLRQPATQEPELEKVWSDVDDDKNAAMPNKLGEIHSGDKNSASSSASTSSSSCSSSSSSSSSSDSASDSDSDSADSDHNADEPIEDKISSSENISNGNMLERMERKIPEQPLKDDDKHLSPESADLVEEKLSPATRAPTDPAAKNPTAPTFEETAGASNSSREGSSSDSSSDSDSDSSSDSGSSSTSHQSNSPTKCEPSDSITAVISENVRESAQAVNKFEAREDHQIPMQIGINPIPTLGNRRRRKPLLSSKKKIII